LVLGQIEAADLDHERRGRQPSSARGGSGVGQGEGRVDAAVSTRQRIVAPPAPRRISTPAETPTISVANRSISRCRQAVGAAADAITAAIAGGAKWAIRRWTRRARRLRG
jgi:hypothetical protein